MKQCQKWWNEEQTEETEEEFLAKHGELTTQEQVIDVLVEAVWRAALEWTLPIIERLGQEACYDIEEELKNDK